MICFQLKLKVGMGEKFEGGPCLPAFYTAYALLFVVPNFEALVLAPVRAAKCSTAWMVGLPLPGVMLVMCPCSK